MERKYLFGPVNPVFADQNLRRQRQAGRCLTFDASGGGDIAVGPADTWGRLGARLPGGWRPDFVVLYLPYTSVPEFLWSAPVPIVALAPDWNLLWHHYRQRLRGCELVMTDRRGVELLARAGIAQARAANLYGIERGFLEMSPPGNGDEAECLPPAGADDSRPIDVLFVGNVNPAVQPERPAWLARLGRLGTRRRVAIHTGVFGHPYRQLLARAKVVFNHGPAWRVSRRAFEAAAAGALVFQEADNAELPAFFRDHQECVYYGEDNLEFLLDHYLDHPEERHRIAAAARDRVQSLTFEDLWDEIAGAIDAEWPAVQDRVRRRPQPRKYDELAARTWQALAAPPRGDPTLVRDLEAALRADSHSAPLHHALGLGLSRMTQDPGSAQAVVETAVACFRRAVECQPGHVVARVNLAEALAAAGKKEEAIEQTRQGLATINRMPELDPACLDAPLYRGEFGPLGVAWERAAWENAGQPAAEAREKRALLRWRLFGLLASLTGDLVHHYEAAAARPGLGPSESMLGCTLAARGYVFEAVGRLREALARNPLDQEAARALFHCLGATGDPDAQRALADDRRLLSRAAPQLVPPEPWFTEPPPRADDLASIIILCCNQLEFTRQCLESVLERTRPPYELILVDNGSTDGTPAYLEEIRSRCAQAAFDHTALAGAPPVRVEVVRNDTNLGFPGGCNQGLRQARGRYLVLLNNDTVVTTGWLEGLIAWSLHDWPAVGMVGPVTNTAPDAQGIRAEYETLDGLEAFAARRRQAFAGKMLQVGRLTGFCLLVRREVFDRTGRFDERYGLGFFDDDDLCIRAREAGFRLLVAPGVYIHHFGSRTFQGLGIPNREQLLKNFAIFRAKWGAELAAGYRLPSAETEGGGDGEKERRREGETERRRDGEKERRRDREKERRRVRGKERQREERMESGSRGSSTAMSTPKGLQIRAQGRAAHPGETGRASAPWGTGGRWRRRRRWSSSFRRRRTGFRW